MERQVISPDELGVRIASKLSEATRHKTAKLTLDNAAANRPHIKKTIGDLPAPEKPAGAAIVIVGGPSLHRKNRIKEILNSGFQGDIIVADGSMGYCLRQGLVPHYVLNVDGHHTRMIRWFGDPELANRPPDDYFGRQDMDPEFWKDQNRTNRELFDMVNKFGPKMKAVIATSAAPNVVARCMQAGMDMVWWNPLFDDYDAPDSITRKLFEDNKVPCMVTGGNVGTSAWVFAHAVLRRKHVALVGMDLGYAPGTPLRSTQYYYELIEVLGDRHPEAFIEIKNPYTGETWFTDPTYYWYREIFIDLAKQAECVTYNCTEGGTLFADHIPFIPLAEFLQKHKNG